jgi:sugar lactone lactonase YvrE
VLRLNETGVDARPIKFLNDIALDKDDIYIVDASYAREPAEAHLEHLEANARGRLFRYNEIDKRLEMLVDGLYFPNGIEVVPDDESILISEASMGRIVRSVSDESKINNSSA